MYQKRVRLKSILYQNSHYYRGENLIEKYENKERRSPDKSASRSEEGN